MQSRIVNNQHNGQRHDQHYVKSDSQHKDNYNGGRLAPESNNYAYISVSASMDPSQSQNRSSSVRSGKKKRKLGRLFRGAVVVLKKGGVGLVRYIEQVEGGGEQGGRNR
eukprot:UN15843